MKRPSLLIACLLGFGLPSAQAQQRLTLEDAVAIALKNNYGVILAKNDSALAANALYMGNAGMLPSIGLSAGATKSTNNLNQKFSTGLEVNKNGVGSSNTTAAISLGWTLFDGFKMFATYNKLESLSAGGSLQLRTALENAAYTIIQLYQSGLLAQQKQHTLESLIGIFEERLSIAQKRLEIGNGNKSDVLQAQIDLNAQKSALIQIQMEEATLKEDLAEAMGMQESSFELVDQYTPAALTETLEQYAARLNKNNPEILLALNAISTAQFMAKESRAALFPTLRLGTSYNFGRNTSNAGFALYNQSAGFSYGLTLNYTLFDGNRVRHNLRNANLELDHALLALEAEKNYQYHLLAKAFQNLNAAAEWLQLEEQNVVLAREHIQIMLERYRLGECTSPEMKDAQQSLVDAEFRLNQARYQAVLAQTAIRRIDGSLVP